MASYFYANSIAAFCNQSQTEILGTLAANSGFADEQTQKSAWMEQIRLLQPALAGQNGRIFFEYSIPRMGRRVDVILALPTAILVIEFKVGETEFRSSAIDQVWDYALDLKNFHETSHKPLVAPILIATEATTRTTAFTFTRDVDGLLSPPLLISSADIAIAIDAINRYASETINANDWEVGRYSPTPTIIEAATALYSQHSVADISRSDASAKNLRDTGQAINEIIDESKREHQKSICFVTGVPGAGKTLVGLDVATRRMDEKTDTPSVFLSGNGPLVAILREALTRDSVRRAKERGERLTKSEAMRRVKLFIQNVHHYRDAYLDDLRAPYDHVAIFDEAQRAWNLTETARFMKQKKNRPDFAQSEPEFLISCLNRHEDWAVIVCLVGGGQEINRGEAGIAEWLAALDQSFPEWNIYISDRLDDSEYSAGNALAGVSHTGRMIVDDRLHLSVSMRSYRAESVSAFVKSLLDTDVSEARSLHNQIRKKYPLLLTRNVSTAKAWVREKARGSERYGMLASSSAERLKAKCINVKAPMDPVHWFLESKEDVRSSYFLEDVATEFHCQGLELDWTCVAWDADLRFSDEGWKTHSFRGSSWDTIRSPERKQYLKNAYRVLLTRARQGMVIIAPHGEEKDPTRLPEFYDQTYEYLKSLGIEEVR